MAMTEDEDNDENDDDDDDGTLMTLPVLLPAVGVDLKQRIEIEPTPR